MYRTRPGSGQDSYAGEHAVCAFRVPEGEKNRRLDAFLGEALRENGISREKVKLAVAEGKVTVNGAVCRKPGTRIFPGDEIAASLPTPAETVAAEAGELAVIWSDENLAVLNKPAGLTVHPAPGLDRGTLANRLLHHFPQVAEQGGPRPGIVHRLDKDTSGLLLVALREKTRLALSRAFAGRAVRKQYLALVYGVPEQRAGTVSVPIGRSLENKTKMAVLPLAKGGREALSEYVTLFSDAGKRFSLVRVAIHTGRTHQIRVHMRHLGHPLLGDAAYALPGLPSLPAKASRQMLHAWSLSFTHPETGAAMAFSQPPPEDFTSLAARLALPMQRVIVTGSPGGGKSTLTKILAEEGLPCWSADEAVKKLYMKDADGWFLLRRRFGQRFVPDAKQDVDKKALFAAMLTSESLRSEVEGIIHPLVRHELEAFWREQKERGAAAAVAEVPLALETWWRKREREKTHGARTELLITVYCPFALRRERLKNNRGWPDETIAAMESWQWPEEKKIRAADIVVDNSGSPEEMRERSRAVAKVLAFLRQRNEKRVQAFLEKFWAGGVPESRNDATWAPESSPNPTGG